MILGYLVLRQDAEIVGVACDRGFKSWVLCSYTYSVPTASSNYYVPQPPSGYGARTLFKVSMDIRPRKNTCSKLT